MVLTDTAEIIKGSRNLEIFIDSSFKEIRLGDWEGKKMEELSESELEQLQYFWHDPELYNRPGLERFSDVQGRFYRGIMKILRDKYERIYVVSHAVAIKCFINYALKKELKNLWDVPFIKQASIVTMTYDNGTFSFKEYREF